MLDLADAVFDENLLKNHKHLLDHCKITLSVVMGELNNHSVN